jgi:ABC-2 type transport system permease protein
MIKSLIGIRLRSAFFSFLSGKDKNGNVKLVSGGKIALYTLLYAFIILSFLFLMFTSAISSALLLIPAAEELYFGLFMILSFTVLFFLSIFETKSELFDCKDNDLLFSLPIKERDIMLSRIFTVLSFNYIAEAIIMIPVAVSYMIMGGGITGIIGSILIFAGVPLLATALASAVGYAVALISKRFKYKTIVTLLFSIAFLAVYFVVYFSFIGNMSAVPEDTTVNLPEIVENYSLVNVIGGVGVLAPVHTVIYVLAVACISFAAMLIISRNYSAII